MRVLIVGDIHGRHEEFAALLARAGSDSGIEAAIQTGDFGFFPDRFAASFEKGCRLPMPVYVIDGNHEDHNWLAACVRNGAAAGWRHQYNIWFQPRASVVRMGSSTIGFLGGALHVDRPQYRHWFRRIANFILPDERSRAAHLFNAERPSLVVTHSCPADIGVGIHGNPEFAHGVMTHVVGSGFDPGPAHDCGEVELTRLWRHLTHKPPTWIFGHFHMSHERTVEGTRFLCAGTLSGKSLMCWDTDTGELGKLSI